MKELMVFHTIQLVKRIMELVAQEIANNDGKIVFLIVH